MIDIKKQVLKSQINWCDNNIKQLSDSVEYWKKEKARFTSELAIL